MILRTLLLSVKDDYFFLLSRFLLGFLLILIFPSNTNFALQTLHVASRACGPSGRRPLRTLLPRSGGHLHTYLYENGFGGRNLSSVSSASCIDRISAAGRENVL